jgi:hypothetical protein
MTTVYVSNTGNDEYTVDGTADDIQINQALLYAHNNGTDASPVTVYLRGPFTYELASWLLVGNNTIFTGDSTAKLRLKNNAGWTNIYTTEDPGTEPILKQRVNPIRNVEVHNFEIDANKDNQSGYVHGKLNYIIMFFTNATNISMHDMCLHDGQSDGMRMSNSDTLYFFNNKVERMGHDGCFFLRSRNFLIFGNRTLIRTNSAHRVYNTGHGKIFNNYMEPYALNSLAGNPGIQIEHGDDTYDMSDIEVYGNEIVNAWGEGMWIIEYGTGPNQSNKGLHVHDNIIRGTGRITTIAYNSGIAIGGWNGATFERNNIEDCYNAGFLVYTSAGAPTTLYVKDNVITGTKITLNSSKPAWTGYGMVCPSGYNTTIQATGNGLDGNASGDYYGNIVYTDAIRVSCYMGMYGAAPTLIDQQIPEEEAGIKPGDWGLVLPSEGGKYKYILYRFKMPEVGERCLIYPAHSGRYYLLKLAPDAQPGGRIIMISDKKGNRWGVVGQ